MSDNNQPKPQDTAEELLYSKPSYCPAISQSALSCMLSCPRKCFYTYRLGLQPAGRTVGAAASKGSLIHRILEVGIDNCDQVQAELKQTKDQLIEQIDQGLDLYGDLARRLEDLDAQFQIAKVACTIYSQKYPLSGHLETVDREQPIILDYLMAPPKEGAAAPRIRLCGMLDWVVRSKDTGHLWIRDFKSTSDDPSNRHVGYSYSFQCMLYRLLALAYYKQAPAGFWLDVIRTPGIKLSSADRDYRMVKKTVSRGPNKGTEKVEKEYFGEPRFVNYVQRVAQWYEATGDSNPFDCRSVFFQDRLASPHHAIHWVLAMATNIQFRPLWPMETDPNLKIPFSQEGLDQIWRRDYTGQRCRDFRTTCDYYQLCSSPLARWPYLFETLYQQADPDLRYTEQTSLKQIEITYQQVLDIEQKTAPSLSEVTNPNTKDAENEPDTNPTTNQ